MRLIFCLIFTASAFFVYGQDGEERKGRPDVPGILQIDYGLSFSANEEVPFKGFGTSAFNVYYLQDMRLGQSKFSFHPGIGVGFDRYRFDLDSLNRHITIVDAIDSSYYVGIQNLNVKKSLFKAAYLDIPVEFRFNTNPDDVSRSFTVALGAKIGFLLSGTSKVVYNVDTETHKIKEKHPFSLTRFRYGAYLRVGGGGFNVFLSYMITPLYKPGEGHLGLDPNMMSAGISMNVF